jgi:hypothetical protein
MRIISCGTGVPVALHLAIPASLPRGPEPNVEPASLRSMADPQAELLARHYRQLRTTRGTVLLGPGSYADGEPSVDAAWFVDGCPLPPPEAVAVLARRHSIADPADVIHALRSLREELERSDDPEAESLADLPALPTGGRGLVERGSG